LEIREGSQVACNDLLRLARRWLTYHYATGNLLMAEEPEVFVGA